MAFGSGRKKLELADAAGDTKRADRSIAQVKLAQRPYWKL